MWAEFIAQLDSVVPALTAIAGGLGTYLVTRIKANKELAINDRLQLSRDQYQLIAELKDMMQAQKEETDELRDQMTELQTVNIKLVFQNERLQATVDTMTIENRKLQAKIDAMGERLDSRMNEQE